MQLWMLLFIALAYAMGWITCHVFMATHRKEAE